MNKIEQTFYDACTREMGRSDCELTADYEVVPQSVIGIYKVDFLVANEFVIEIDGYEFHKTKEQREADYKRERYLFKNGYRVIRFTGTEVFLNPDKCACEALQMVDDDLSHRTVEEAEKCQSYHEYMSKRAVI